MDLTSTLVGIPLGILTSLVAWWVLFHRIVPKIEFSPDISKFYFQNLGMKYRIKFRNSGRRGIIDMEVFPILRIRGLNHQLPDNLFNIRLNTSLINNRISNLKENRVITLLPENTPKFGENIFPEYIREKYQSKELNLEDLFKIRNDVKLVIEVFGYDEFSGARKLFSSKPYTIKDIQYGTFDHTFSIDKTGLKVIEKPQAHGKGDAS